MGRHRRTPPPRSPIAALAGAACAAALCAALLADPGPALEPVTATAAPTTAATTARPTSTPTVTVEPIAQPTTTPSASAPSTTAIPVRTTTAPPSATTPPPTPSTPVAPAPDPVRPTRACPTAGFSGVRPHVAAAGHLLSGRFDVGQVLGVGSRANPRSDHPRGLALDLFADRATGDELAAYALDSADALAVRYVIWRQRINYGAGWEQMADRGGITANHFDHVHISFRPESGTELSC